MTGNRTGTNGNNQWSTLTVATCGAAAPAVAAGAVLASGFDGLSVTIGVALALVLGSIVHSTAATSQPSANHPIVQLALMIGAVFLIAAELRIAAIAIDLQVPARGVGTMTAATAAGLVAVGILGFSSFARIVTPATLGLLAVVLAALAAALVWRDGPLALVSLPAVPDITALEDRLREKRLADPATLRVHTVPFLRVDQWNFAALVAVLGFGLAALAAGLGSRPRSPAQPQSSTSGRTRLLTVALLCAAVLPALAATGKRDLMAVFETGLKIAAPPPWLSAHVSAGVIEACQKIAATGQQISELCTGSAFGRAGLLRWQDVHIPADAGAFVMLDAARTPPFVTLLIAAIAIVAAAISVARSARIIDDLAARRTSAVDAGSPRATVIGGFVALMLLAAAASVATAVPDALALMTLAAGIAAVAILPRAVAAALFGRASRVGIAVAVVAGVTIVLTTGLASKLAPLAAFEMSGAAQSAPPATARRLATLAAQARSAQSEPQRLAAVGQSIRIVDERVTWLGLRSGAASLWGLAVALALALASTLAATTGGRARDSDAPR